MCEYKYFEDIGGGFIMHYNGIMFGNGLTLNLLNQIKEFIPHEKRYLLNINDFLNHWTNNKLTAREERIFY